MAIRDLFKKSTESAPDRRPSLRDPDQILAWLEELQRLFIPVEIALPDCDSATIQAKVRSVQEDPGQLSLGFLRKPGKEPSPGQNLDLAFNLGRRRYSTELVYRGRGNYLEYRFSLPEAIFHSDRRGTARVLLGSREECSVTVLQDFFEGVGLHGRLLDISRGGCSFRVDRGILVKTGKRLAPTADLMEPGAPLALVRLPDLPRLPQMECCGCLCSLRLRDEGIVAGVQFRGLEPRDQDLLGQFLKERDSGAAYPFPPKRRLRDLLVAESDPADSGGPAPADAAAAPVPAGPDQDAEPDASAAQAGLSEEQRLRILHKSSKRLLLVMVGELERITLMAQLRNDGYRWLLEAGSLVKALDLQRRMVLDAVLLDQTVGHLGALKVLEAMQESGLPPQAKIVVLQQSVDHQLTLAHRGGRIHLLVPRPLDFLATLKGPLEALLGLDGPRTVS